MLHVPREVGGVGEHGEGSVFEEKGPLGSADPEVNKSAQRKGVKIGIQHDLLRTIHSRIKGLKKL